MQPLGGHLELASAGFQSELGLETKRTVWSRNPGDSTQTDQSNLYWPVLRNCRGNLSPLVDNQEDQVLRLLRPNTEAGLLLLTRDRRTLKMKTLSK